MEDPQADQLNVLMVDDDPILRNLLEDIVTREGHCAVPAESAEEILKLLPYWTFHVAFVDQRLPGMEGLVLGEYLRRNNENIMVALITGEPSPTLEQKSIERGIEFIAKPFSVDEVLGVIEHYKSAAAERERKRKSTQDDNFVPPLSHHIDDVTACFDVPQVPSRIESRLTGTIKGALNSLRSPHRYNERDRIIALSGLITAKVLGIRLPKTAAERTLYEEYDALMKQRGRREEFS